MICLALYHDSKFGDRFHVSQKTHSQTFVREERGRKNPAQWLRAITFQFQPREHFQTGFIKYTITSKCSVEPSLLCWYQKSSIFRDSHFANCPGCRARDDSREHRTPPSTAEPSSSLVPAPEGVQWQWHPREQSHGRYSHGHQPLELKNICHAKCYQDLYMLLKISVYPAGISGNT